MAFSVAIRIGSMNRRCDDVPAVCFYRIAPARGRGLG
jgi:hypothetical protein